MIAALVVAVFAVGLGLGAAVARPRATCKSCRGLCLTCGRPRLRVVAGGKGGR